MIPQRHTVDIWRPTLGQDTADKITGYSLMWEDVRCFIQPMNSAEEVYYSQHGLEDMASVYTSRTDLGIERNDILKHGDTQYHVVGVKNGLVAGIYLELAAYSYPEDAKKRLSKEAYE